MKEASLITMDLEVLSDSKLLFDCHVRKIPSSPFRIGNWNMRLWFGIRFTTSKLMMWNVCRYDS